MAHCENMIELTSLSGKPLLINPDQVRYLESVPDTIVCFVDGSRLPVRETFDEIKNKFYLFKASLSLKGDISCS